MKSHSRTIALLLTIAVLATAWPGQQNVLLAMERAEPTVRISGSAGMPGVRMTGLPGNPVTDQSGRYEARVPRRWSGTVMPAKEGFTFDPPQMKYELRDASADFENQNYGPALITYEISGTTSVGGVMIQGAGRVYTDENGDYRLSVDYGWSGTLAPKKEGYRFNPPNRIYVKVTSNQTREDYAPQPTRRRIQVPQITPNVLAIPTDEIDTELIAQTTEDMRIMLHLLQKAVQKDTSPRPIGGLFTDFDDFFTSARRSPQAIYLQGYGVLFLMEVDYPIVARPTTQSTEQAQHGDPAWQRARQEVFSLGTTTRSPTTQPQAPSPEDITKDLIDTLRHAANIRHIQPDERVIVTVIGRSFSAMPQTPATPGYPPPGVPPAEVDPLGPGPAEPGADAFGGMGGGMGGMMGMGAMQGMGGMMAGGAMGGGMMGGAGYGGSGGFGGGMGGYGGGGMGGMGGMYGGGIAGFGGPAEGSWYIRGPWWTSGLAGPQTVTTIQATKADIDALAKGHFSIEQFRQKVKIFTY